MKKFESFEQQVKYSVENMVMFNNYPEVSEDWFDYAPASLLTEDEDGNCTEVYQWFAVSIFSEDEYTERLGIFYDEDLDLYILPVTNFGTLWEGVQPVDFTKELN